MKKMLIVTATLKLGGLEKVAMDCYYEAKKLGYYIDFIVFDEKEQYFNEIVKKNDDQIFCLTTPSKNRTLFCKQLKNIISIYGPYEVVHSHIYYSSGIVLREAKKMGVKTCISHCHSSKRESDKKVHRKIYHFLMKKMIIKYSDYYCACSSQAGENFYGKKLFNEKGIVLVNKISTSQFLYDEEARKRIRAEFSISEDTIVIGSVGRLVPAKNFKLLIDMFHQCYAQKSNYKLMIVGEGELRESLEKQIKELKITDQVILSGIRTDIGEVLSAMDVFVLSSKHEGLGIALIEAQANGLGCVAIQNVVAKEAMFDDRVLLIEDPDDCEQWENAFELAAVPLESRRMLPEGIKNLEQNFDQTMRKIYEN